MGKWGFARDPYEMARQMIAHIDKKRKALGIDKAAGAHPWWIWRTDERWTLLNILFNAEAKQM